MDTVREDLQFRTIDDAIRKFLEEFKKGQLIVAAKPNEKDDYKERIIELDHVFYSIDDSDAVLSSFKSLTQTPFWLVSEILTEMLAIDPPIMDRYMPEVMEWSYKLRPNRKARYLYGNRWNEFGQLENTFAKLRDNPTTKKAVMTIFEGYDTDPHQVDVPCTTQYQFLLRNGRLDMTTFFRSHDFFSGWKYDIALSSHVMHAFVWWLRHSGMQVDPGRLFFYDNSLHIYPHKDGERLSKLEREVLGTQKRQIVDVNDRYAMSMQEYFAGLKTVKDVEESSYWGRFDVAEKKVSEISNPLFRDYARVYLSRNLRHHGNKEKAIAIKSELERLDLKTLYNI